MKNYYYFIIVLFLCVICNSCNNNDDDAVVEKAIELNEVEKEIVVDQSGFAVDLFSAVSATQKEEGNMVVSPLSTSMALSMLAGGVEQQISEKILSGLGFGNYTLDEVNAYNKKLYEGLPNVSSLANVSLANSLWLNSGNMAVEEYQSVLGKYYYADVYNCDFAGERTLEEINKWCYTNTNKMIPRFMEEIKNPDDTYFMFLDALSFKSAWEFPYKNTKKGVFTNIDSVKQPVKFMFKNDKYVYGEVDEKYSFVRLPYKTPYEMVLVLPNRGVTIDECANALREGIWSDVINCNRQDNLYNVDLQFPKFEISSSAESLDLAMEVMGIPLSVHSSQITGLNLAKVGNIKLKINQANTITVDEEGTSASTVTSVSGEYESYFPNKSAQFIADRPFIFFVYEKGSGTILYIGKVVTM